MADNSHAAAKVVALANDGLVASSHRDLTFRTTALQAAVVLVTGVGGLCFCRCRFLLWLPADAAAAVTESFGAGVGLWTLGLWGLFMGLALAVAAAMVVFVAVGHRRRGP